MRNKLYASILVMFLGFIISGVGFGFTFTLVNNSQQFPIKILAGRSHCISYNVLPTVKKGGTRLMDVEGASYCVTSTRVIHFHVYTVTQGGWVYIGAIHFRWHDGLHYVTIYPESGASVTYSMQTTTGPNPGVANAPDTLSAVVTFTDQ